MNSKVYKWCAVPLCKNTSIMNPDKLFVYVPHKKIIRDKWLKLARRSPNSVATDSPIYFCEDHFDLPNDMENYMEYHIMGSVSQVRMKPGCMPKKFTCQPDRIIRTSDSIERPYVAKKRRMMIIEECEKQFEESRMAAEHSQSVEIASGSSVQETIEETSQPTPRMLQPISLEVVGAGLTVLFGVPCVLAWGELPFPRVCFYGGMAGTSFAIFLSAFILMVAAFSKKPSLMRPWVVCSWVTSVALLVVSVAGMVTIPLRFRDADIAAEESIVISAYFVHGLLLFYMSSVVNSYQQELKMMKTSKVTEQLLYPSIHNQYRDHV